MHSGLCRLARMVGLTRVFARLLWAVVFMSASTSLGYAHPHVSVVMESQIVYAADGSIVGVRHAWTFDDMFSAYAIQGLRSKTKGVFTREELAALAEVNVTSLREYEFFTFAKANGRKASFKEPVDYWLAYANNVLTLHFMLPLKSPIIARTLDIEIYDPSFFVFFEFARQSPVILRGGPADCKLAIERPKELDVKQAQSLSEEFFNTLATSGSWGARFNNKFALRCP